MVRTGIAALALMMAFTGAVAQSASVAESIRTELGVTAQSLAQCKLESGRQIDPAECLRWQRAVARAVQDEQLQAEKAQRSQAELAVAEESLRRDQAAEQERRSRAKAEADDRARLEKERDAREAAAEQARRNEEERQEAVLAKACGRDYERPRVGMTVSRAEKCLGELALLGQINRKDGVVTTYQGGGFVLHVMSGKVVAWTK